MTSKRNYKGLIYAFITLILLVVTVISGRGNLPAFADSSANVNVLKELQKDGNFKVADYPNVADDYSIQVIQIAESETGYLYVYTYQPCQATRYQIATDISMSLSESADGMKVYGLVLANTNGVFCKYLVKGVKVSEAATRYYNISSIYRAWDKDIDSGTGNNNTLDKKAYPVRNVYKVTTENGAKKYERNPTYTVNIINPYVDYLLYLETGSLPLLPVKPWLPSTDKGAYVDSHYVAFSTDWEIDKLLSATVHYDYYTADGQYSTFLGFDCGGDVVYGNRQDGYAYPKYDQRAEVESGYQYLGKTHTYTWDRIQTVAEFIATEEKLTDETKSNLAGKQWVLRFLETERTQKDIEVLGYKKYNGHWTIVDRVAVLRLEFETDGVVYNLGTVCDMQSGDEFAGNVEKIPDDDGFWQWLYNELFVKRTWWVWLITVVIVLVVLSFLTKLLSLFIPVFKPVWNGLCVGFKYLFIGLWYVISAPFRFIAWIVKKVQERGKNPKPPKVKKGKK